MGEATAEVTKPSQLHSVRRGRSSTPRVPPGVAFLVFFLAATAATIWFIHRFSANVIIFDQWADINVIRHAHSGTLSFGTLWAQHNENRILFPNLIVLLLAYTTHFNIVVEDYLSGVMWCVTTGLLIITHKRRCPSMPWIWYCPVVLAFLSFNPVVSTLMGFLLSWYLVLLGLAVALFLLDRSVLSWLGLFGAVIAAVVGSFSSLQGLLIWPAGLVLLCLRRRSKPFVLVWVVCALVTGILYFVHYDFAAGGGSVYSFSHPLVAIRLFFFTIGDVVGVRLQPAHLHGTGEPYEVVILGILIFAIAVWGLIHGLRRGRSGASPIGVALIVFGLLFSVFITVGRLEFGLSNASRYTPFELMIWVGAYLALFDRPVGWSKQARSDLLERLDYLTGIRKRPTGEVLPGKQPRSMPWEQVADVSARLILIGLIFVQIVSGSDIGLLSARDWHRREVAVANVTVNINKDSDALVQKEEGNFYPVPVIRQLAEFAKSDRLSLFANPAVAGYTRQGSIPSIASHALPPLHPAAPPGSPMLDAGASDSETPVRHGAADVRQRRAGPIRARMPTLAPQSQEP